MPECDGVTSKGAKEGRTGKVTSKRRYGRCPRLTQKMADSVRGRTGAKRFHHLRGPKWLEGERVSPISIWPRKGSGSKSKKGRLERQEDPHRREKRNR